MGKRAELKMERRVELKMERKVERRKKRRGKRMKKWLQQRELQKKRYCTYTCICMYMVHKHTCMSCAISISVCMIVSDTVTDTLCYVVFATTFLLSRQRLEVMWRRRRRPSLGPGPSVSGEGNLQLLPLPRSVRGGREGGREEGWEKNAERDGDAL